MYKVISILTTILFTLGLSAQDAGIRWHKIKFKEALELAKAEDKLIFIDAYTTWCGPCKKMDAEVFPDPRVGAYFNEHFINLKLDMESARGARVQSKYAVRSYPTFLFIDGEGNVMERDAGWKRPEVFLTIAQKANSVDNYFRIGQRFESGEATLGDIVKYLLSRQEELSATKRKSIIESAVSNREDWNDSNYYLLSVLDVRGIDDEISKGFVENAEKAFQVLGNDLYLNNLQARFFVTAGINASQLSTWLAPDEMDSLYRKYAENIFKELSVHYRLLYHSAHANSSNILEAANAYYALFEVSNDGEILKFVRSMVMDDKLSEEQLLQTKQYLLKAISLNKNSYGAYMELSKVYKLLGQEDKSVKCFDKANAVANKQGIYLIN